jgi:hypothetical protein
MDTIAKSDEHIKISIKRIIEFNEQEKKELIGNQTFQTTMVINTRITMCTI